MLRVLPCRGKLALQHVTYLPWRAWLWRNFINQKSVFIHLLRDRFYSCAVKRASSLFNSFCTNAAKQDDRVLARFFFMEVLFPSRTTPSNPWTEVAKFKTCLGKRSYLYSNFHYVWIILRENKLVYSENLNVFTMITPIITYLSFYFFFYRCLKTRSLSSYTYRIYSNKRPTLNKRPPRISAHPKDRKS